MPAAFSAGGAGSPLVGSPRATARAAAVAVAPLITATKSDAFPDPDNDGQATPGDTITYTVQINNNGTDATGVQFTDTIDANTTQVGGFSTTPVAIDDSYTAVGNVQINVPAAGGLTSNDSDPDGGPVMAVPATTTSANNGNVTVNADGSFTYNPAPGFEGADTFTYTVVGASSPSNTATVTVTVSDMIWFIDDSAAAGGDGRLGTPFNSIAAYDAGAADEPNDNIFIYSGSYADGLALLSGQALIGEGSTASLSAVTGITPPSYSAPLPATGGANPSIGGASGIAVATSNLIRGVTVANSAGTGISGSNFGTLAVADTTINSGGPALDLDNGQLNAAFQSITSTGSATAGVRLANIAVGSVFSGGPTAINSRGATGIELDTVAGSIAFGATTIPNPGGAGGHGISVRNSAAAVSFASATISDSNVTVPQVDTTPADNFPDNDGDGDAIFLSNNTGSFAVSGGALSNCGNDCVDARESTNVTLSGVAISAPGLDVLGSTLPSFGGHGIYALNLKGSNGLAGVSVSDVGVTNRHGLLLTSNMFAQTFTVGGATNNASTNCTFSNIIGSAVLASSGGTSALNLTVQNSTFQNSPVDGKTNINASTAQTGQATFNILNNTFSNVFTTASTGEGVINLAGLGSAAGNTFAANVSGNTLSGVGNGTTTCNGGVAACLGSLNAITVSLSGATSLPGTILVDGNNLTNTQQGGISLDINNTAAGSSAVAAKITNNIIGVVGSRVGGGATATVRSGIRVTNSRVGGNNLLLSGNTVRNGNATAGSALNAPGVFVRSTGSGNLSVTMTGNDIETENTGVNEVRAETNAAGATLCLDISGNTIAAGAGLVQLNRSAGTYNVEQADAAAVAAANGIPAANVIASAGITFGVACLPPVAMLRRDANSSYQQFAYLAGARPAVVSDLLPGMDEWRTNSKSLGGLSFSYAARNVALGSGLTDTVVRPAREAAPAAPAYAPAAATLALSGETITVNIGTLPAGKSMTITFQATINNTIAVPEVSNQGTVSGSNFSPVVTDDPATAAFGDPTVTPVFLGVPPDISCPADISVGTDAGVSTASVSFSVTATGTPSPTIDCKVGATSITSPHTFALGETTVVCTATNGVAPDDSCSFKVTVTDDEAPQIDCPDDIVVSLPLNSNATGVAVNFSVTATDNADPTPTINTSVASGSIFPVGTTTVTATATDDAGNQSTCQFNVTVLYNFTGFFSPVSNPPVLNEVKAGQNVPIKFSLSGNKGLNVFAAGYPASQQINCADNVPINVLEETETSGNSTLTYDAGSDRYQYSWKTEKSWAGTCRVLVVKLADGTDHVAYFKFK